VVTPGSSGSQKLVITWRPWVLLYGFRVYSSNFMGFIIHN
jgi:hypothetical protein